MRVEIRIKGKLNPNWSEWFGDLTIRQSATGETVLHGFVPDQAALYGIIARLRDLGLALISIQSEACEPITRHE